MSSTIVALDLETTGLDPERHHIWEIGAIVRDHRDPRYNGQWQIMLRPNLAAADPAALRVGRYYERAPLYLSDPACPAFVVACPADWPSGPTTRMDVALWLALMLDGATIVGANPAFDAAFLTRFLRTHWQAPTWHHHLVDVAALAAGYLAASRPTDGPPWRTADLAADLEVTCPPELRHTALGDADWALAIYDTVMTGGKGKA